MSSFSWYEKKARYLYIYNSTKETEKTKSKIKQIKFIDSKTVLHYGDVIVNATQIMRTGFGPLNISLYPHHNL